MKHAMIAAVAAGAAVLMAAGAVQAKSLKAEGGSAASLTSLVPQLMSKYAAPMGYEVRVNVNQTLTRATLKVANGKLDLTTTPAGAYHKMTRGAGPYKKLGDKAKKASKNIRALFAFIGGHIHAITYEDSGISSFNDIKGKRVFVGPPAGSMSGQSIGLIRAITGLEPKKDYEAVKLGFSAANQAFEDGKFDLFMRSGTMGSAAIDQFGAAKKFRIVGIPKSSVGTSAWKEYAKVPGRAADPVPAGTYSNQVNNGEDHLLAAYVMMMTVNKSMDDQIAYDLTKSMMENLGEAYKVSSGLKPLTLESAFKNMNAVLHPGAVKYYKERGIIIPKSVMP